MPGVLPDGWNQGFFRNSPEAFKVLPLTGSTTSGVCLYGSALKLVKPSRQYKAHLQLRQDLGVHTWNTEPFTLDELLRTGVGCWFVHPKTMKIESKQRKWSRLTDIWLYLAKAAALSWDKGLKSSKIWHTWPSLAACQFFYIEINGW